MTQCLVALFNGVGGAASGLVGVAALSIADGSFTYVTIILSFDWWRNVHWPLSHGKLSRRLVVVLSPSLGKVC